MATAAQQLAAHKAYGGGKDGRKIPAYLEQEVLSWSKEKVILKMYDLFIVSCKRNDTTKMSRVVIGKGIKFGDKAGYTSIESSKKRLIALQITLFFSQFVQLTLFL